MIQIDNFIHSVARIAGALFQQKDELDSRINKFLGIIERTQTEFDSLISPNSEKQDDLTVGDVRPEAGMLHTTPAETDKGLITHPISFKEDDPPSILEVFPSSKQGDSTMTICPVCGLSFTGTKKYCSKKCAQVVYNKNYMEKTLKLKDQKKEEHPNNFETTKKVSESVTDDMTAQGEVIKKKIIPKRNKMKSKPFKKSNQRRLQKLIADPEPVEPIDPDYPFSPDQDPVEISDNPF